MSSPADSTAARFRKPLGALPAPDSPLSASAKANHTVGLSAAVHTCARSSMLSSERIYTQQHAGLVNLGMVIILAANSRLILENIIKYGLRANPVRWLQEALRTGATVNHVTIIGFAILLLSVLFAFTIERIAAGFHSGEMLDCKKSDSDAPDPASSQRNHRKARIMETVVALLHLVFTCMLPMLVPFLTVAVPRPDPIPASVLTSVSIVIWMKLVSYAQCSYDLRKCQRQAASKRPRLNPATDAGSTGWAHGNSPLNPAVAQRPSASGREEAIEFQPTLQYPDNVTAGNLAYFIVAPTLTYQMEYPRTRRIRVRWLARRLVELFAYTGLLLFIVEQYIMPSILNSMKPLRSSSNLLAVTERVLKLSLPCLYAWLCIFYIFFHLYLNVLAELTFFADREFYKDWWNAKNIGEYWRLWNMPVHKWMMRTVYSPLIRMGSGKLVAGFCCFFLSGVLHELAVGVPLRMFRYWAFSGMLFQLPLVYITSLMQKKLHNEQLGNVIFWVTFCVVGQPMILLLYYHDFLLEHTPQVLAHQLS